MFKYLFIFLIFVSGALFGQQKGEVTVVKDPFIDSLINKRLQLNTVKPTTTNPGSTAIVTTMGYRVQIFYGAGRKEAFAIQSKFKASYPKHNTYITYKEPNYYLRVGDFRTRLEAQKFLNDLRPAYPTLFIFREKINAPVLEAAN